MELYRSHQEILESQSIDCQHGVIRRTVRSTPKFPKYLVFRNLQCPSLLSKISMGTFLTFRWITIWSRRRTSYGPYCILYIRDGGALKPRP